MRVCVARWALLGTTSVALICAHGIAAAQQAAPPATGSPNAPPAAEAPPSNAPVTPTAPSSGANPPAPAAASQPPPAAASPAQTSGPAEIDIPQVTVEGRQPRATRRTSRNEPAARTAPAPATPPAVTSATPPFAPSALSSGQIQSSTSPSFGNLFFAAPGATSAGLATASARPVLRGLSDAKVRIQENGIGSVDVSDIAQDHGVPLDPLALQKTEVFRGPGALRFGSQAVGGIVDVTNNRIPTAAPIGGMAAELRSAVTSVDSGWESGLLLDAGSGNAAVHADVYGRGAQDYRVPSYPYLVLPSPAPAFNGRQPNSAMQAAGAAIGGSYLFEGGYAGLSISRFTSDYHVPGIASSESQQHNDLEQTKIMSKGEYRPDATAIAAVRYWLGYSDYRHDEIDVNQTSLGNFQTIGATFKNRQTEGKVEVESQPVATPRRADQHRRRTGRVRAARYARPGDPAAGADHDRRRIFLRGNAAHRYAANPVRRPYRIRRRRRHLVRVSVELLAAAEQPGKLTVAIGFPADQPQLRRDQGSAVLLAGEPDAAADPARTARARTVRQRSGRFRKDLQDRQSRPDAGDRQHRRDRPEAEPRRYQVRRQSLLHPL